MHVSNFNYDLPKSLIAKYPPKVRGSSRLLVLNRQTNEIIDDKYANVIDYFQTGDVLVLNDTKVIKARLQAKRTDGALREIIILEKHSFDHDWYRHQVLYHGKLRENDELRINSAKLVVKKILGNGVAIVHSDQDLLKLVANYGKTPLPPYLHRQATVADEKRYQTVWAKDAGSVAAPTASLNMTETVIERLRQKGVKVVYLTLHVGLGTFLPIRTNNIEEHHMHQEYFQIPRQTIQELQTAHKMNKKIIALGTTVARTLEYAHEQIFVGEPKNITGEADIFIYPGYEFKTIDALLTNYHAPKSTVLMLTAAFAGWDKLLLAYQHAIQEKYHFLSYGDSMLIL